MVEPMLEVKDLEVRYDAIRAVKGIDFHVNEGEIIALIGANGAGKTTTLHTISGLLRPTAGTIRYQGTDLTTLSAASIVRLGLAQVPEGRRVFSQMSVRENLEMGAFAREETREELQQEYEEIYKLLPRLYERRRQIAGTLSGGEQQMLAIGRAMMSKPEMLLLDEPSMGLAPLLVQEIFEIIKQLNKQGMTILLVEQNARMALEIADRAYVLETGRMAMQGDAKELSDDPKIKAAYLGGE